MSQKISIEGLDKAAVFAALYNGARGQGLGLLHYNPEPMSTEQARARFGDSFGYFDYVDGRVMKVNLSGSEFDPWLYDRDNGDGAAARIINALRATGDTNPEEAEMSRLEGTRNAAIEAKKHIFDKTVSERLKGMLTMSLGLGEFADELGPKIDEILGDEDEEA